MKYPSTLYLPCSPGAEKQDELFDPARLVGIPVVITIKMDGSNITMTDLHVAARNGETAHHNSFDFAKAKHAAMKHLIPRGFQIYGEWLYAKHSIHYKGNLALPSYLQLFAIHNIPDKSWLGWANVKMIAKALGEITVPVLKHARYNSEAELVEDVEAIAKQVISLGHEGIIIRNSESFGVLEDNVAKYVRKDHVQTDKHWQIQPIVRNELKT